MKSPESSSVRWAVVAAPPDDFRHDIFPTNSVHVDHIRKNIDKRRDSAGLNATLRPAATAAAISAAEDHIGQPLPEQVRAFYSEHNGLAIVDPPFVILSLEELRVDERNRIQFATADGTQRICFDCSGINSADQWDIVDADTGYRITLSMASFWGNKMWKWIDRRLAFWRGEV